MFFRALRQKSRQPCVPDNTRVYAVGDVHGRLDLLDALLAKVLSDDAARVPADTVLLFLGDLIDRGPQSAEVVERCRLLAQGSLDVRFLMGNHEEIFLDVLTNGSLAALRVFRRMGGEATIMSYGMAGDDYRAASGHDILRFLERRVPPAHLAFLHGFSDRIVIGDYAFVHAGIRPNVALEQQQVSDLRWIRGEFLRSTKMHDKMIVHGHTITEQIDEQPNRIGLDTGAYETGRLSAMGFERDVRWLIDARSGPISPDKV